MSCNYRLGPRPGPCQAMNAIITTAFITFGAFLNGRRNNHLVWILKKSEISASSEQFRRNLRKFFLANLFKKKIDGLDQSIFIVCLLKWRRFVKVGPIFKKRLCRGWNCFFLFFFHRRWRQPRIGRWSMWQGFFIRYCADFLRLRANSCDWALVGS